MLAVFGRGQVGHTVVDREVFNRDIYIKRTKFDRLVEVADVKDADEPAAEEDSEEEAPAEPVADDGVDAEDDEPSGDDDSENK